MKPLTTTTTVTEKVVEKAKPAPQPAAEPQRDPSPKSVSIGVQVFNGVALQNLHILIKIYKVKPAVVVMIEADEKAKLPMPVLRVVVVLRL
jgi:protein TonB